MKIFLDLRGVENAEQIREETSEFIDSYFTDSSKDFGLHIDGDKITKDGVELGLKVTVATPDDMNQAMEFTPPANYKYIFFETNDWKIIPLENVIAKYQALGIELIASATSLDEIALLSEILEVGVDVAVVPPSLVEDNREFFETKGYGESIELIELTVSAVEVTGSGERVCVDTAAVLQPGEGLLMGSTSTVFVLVEAEVKESGFVSSRPFRVNAGPVSSYVLNYGGKTNYLSELHAGSYVMIVDRKGHSRKELVGRVKIERRPFVIVRVKVDDTEYPVLLQNAETVRLVTPEGSISVTELKVGDIILGATIQAGRHFGISVDEYILER